LREPQGNRAVGQPFESLRVSVAIGHREYLPCRRELRPYAVTTHTDGLPTPTPGAMNRAPTPRSEPLVYISTVAAGLPVREPERTPARTKRPPISWRRVGVSPRTR